MKLITKSIDKQLIPSDCSCYPTMMNVYCPVHGLGYSKEVLKRSCRTALWRAEELQMRLDKISEIHRKLKELEFLPTSNYSVSMRKALIEKLGYILQGLL